MQQQALNDYFSTVWQSNLAQYKYSGWALVDKIQPNELVLDVGCGFNEFKSQIPNLVGIDPANDRADFKIPIEYFRNDIKFDVAFCLGSINFGSEINIVNQIANVIACLKPNARIFWRCNPGLADHQNEQCKNIEFYPWSIEKHAEFADLFRFRLAVAKWDTNNRIYAEWIRTV
jgi:hypothetical protein